MGMIGFLDKKKFSLIDVSLDEVAMFALALLLAKYWSTATALAWY